ncbi:M48 family metallopeptidase [Blastochloris tepida]|uniref:Metal-dependent hydrolase n=1 Tax=Blastochloris tepida TaxID=2233851 RepID=A0A348G4R0_9HYPH|nr:SprT family zinc-dependent metalloprotease [Blastochloris tepida]BBF94543.1 metal-dependent hydrolase [Blastochloris tepida]
MMIRRGSASSPTIPTLILRHAGESVIVAVRRSARAQRYTLRLRAAERDAVLTVPKRGSMAEAAVFAERHAAWLMARLSRLPPQVSFLDGASVPLRGVVHRIEHRPGMRGTAWTEDGADGTPRLVVAGEAPHVPRRVHDFLVRQARADLTEASTRHAAAVGREISRITLRDVRSRWGSCSASGRLSFSWRIVMAPPWVIDYLAAHEVAHLVHLDHSHRFWSLVAELCPGYAAARQWLRRHGAELHRYGK